VVSCCIGFFSSGGEIAALFGMLALGVTLGLLFKKHLVKGAKWCYERCRAGHRNQLDVSRAENPDQSTQPDVTNASHNATDGSAVSSPGSGDSGVGTANNSSATVGTTTGTFGALVSTVTPAQPALPAPTTAAPTIPSATPALGGPPIPNAIGYGSPGAGIPTTPATGGGPASSAKRQAPNPPISPIIQTPGSTVRQQPQTPTFVGQQGKFVFLDSLFILVGLLKFS
jgi:hypothetical protein